MRKLYWFDCLKMRFPLADPSN